MPPFTDNYLGYLLARCSHEVSSPFHQHLKQQGITITTWRILGSILEQPMSVNELAKKILVQQPTLSKALDRLERDKLVSRRRDILQRRQVNILICERGRDIVTKLIPIANQYEKQSFAKISSEKQQQLKSLLLELIEKGEQEN